MKILRQVSFSKKEAWNKISRGYIHQNANPDSPSYHDIGGNINPDERMKHDFMDEFRRIRFKGRKIDSGKGTDIYYDRKSGKTLISSHLDSLDNANRRITYSYITDEKDPDKVAKELKKVVERAGLKITPPEYKGELEKYKKGVRNKKIAAGIVGTTALGAAGYATYKHLKNKKKDSDKK